MYRLEEIVFLCVSGQDISRNFLPDEVILLVTAYGSLSQENDDNSRTMPRYQPMYRGSTGRPALDIPRETLKLYLSYGFSLKKIANMFGTSRKTIRSRTTYVRKCQSMMIYQMRLQLDEAVSVLHNFSNCGIRRMKGFLLEQGIRVQWNRVRSSLCRTDPSRIQLRTSLQFSVSLLQISLHSFRKGLRHRGKR